MRGIKRGGGAFLKPQSIQLRGRAFAGNEIGDISKSQIKGVCTMLKSIALLFTTESF